MTAGFNNLVLFLYFWTALELMIKTLEELYGLSLVSTVIIRIKLMFLGINLEGY